jgi:hypothetical protein
MLRVLACTAVQLKVTELPAVMVEAEAVKLEIAGSSEPPPQPVDNRTAAMLANRTVRHRIERKLTRITSSQYSLRLN